ncbi:hypothetical protein GCM10018966_029100 [Streptomyces yanii]
MSAAHQSLERTLGLRGLSPGKHTEKGTTPGCPSATSRQSPPLPPLYVDFRHVATSRRSPPLAPLYEDLCRIAVVRSSITFSGAVGRYARNAARAYASVCSRPGIS